MICKPHWRIEGRGGCKLPPPQTIKMKDDKTTAKERYDARTAVYVSLKLNKGTDADILRAIDGKPKQTEIKRLIRKGIGKSE